jgi:hypothetical protein
MQHSSKNPHRKDTIMAKKVAMAPRPKTPPKGIKGGMKGGGGKKMC